MMFLIIVFLLAGCGRKGDPVPPEAAAIMVQTGQVYQETGKGFVLCMTSIM